MIDCYKDFEPVMTVKTQVAFVKTLPPVKPSAMAEPIH